MISRQFFVTLALCLGLRLIATSQAENSVELLKDPRFERGAIMLAPTPGKREKSAELKPDPDGAPPEWELAQWASKYPALQRMEFASRWSNPGKTVAFPRSAADTGDVTLEMRGSAEYGKEVRVSTAPWPHLLIEQTLENSPSVAALQRLDLRLTYRVNRCELNARSAYDPAIHAAQLVLFIHVSNADRNSPNFGHYLHFGVPLFDSRHAMPPAHIAADTGGTGMHIYMPALREFTDGAIETGQWVALSKDILPLIRRGLSDAFEKGVFGESRDPASYRLTFFTVGWELPGNFDVSADLRSLSLRASVAN